jgi:hypothetical protein
MNPWMPFSCVHHAALPPITHKPKESYAPEKGLFCTRIIEITHFLDLKHETGILKQKKTKKENIQQQVFAGGHPPNY